MRSIDILVPVGRYERIRDPSLADIVKLIMPRTPFVITYL
jgi:hypothetical protein